MEQDREDYDLFYRKESLRKGEEAALLLTIEEEMYYLMDSGQKYRKGEDGLYYNTFGEALSWDTGEACHKDRRLTKWFSAV